MDSSIIQAVVSGSHYGGRAGSGVFDGCARRGITISIHFGLRLVFDRRRLEWRLPSWSIQLHDKVSFDGIRQASKSHAITADSKDSKDIVTSPSSRTVPAHLQSKHAWRKD